MAAASHVRRFWNATASMPVRRLGLRRGGDGEVGWAFTAVVSFHGDGGAAAFGGECHVTMDLAGNEGDEDPMG
jgi:hypothetical protein